MKKVYNTKDSFLCEVKMVDNEPFNGVDCFCTLCRYNSDGTFTDIRTEAIFKNPSRMSARVSLEPGEYIVTRSVKVNVSPFMDDDQIDAYLLSAMQKGRQRREDSGERTK